MKDAIIGIVAGLFVYIILILLFCPQSQPEHKCLLITDTQGRVVYHGSEKAYTLKPGYRVARWKE